MKAILSNGICGEKIFKQRGNFKGGGKHGILLTQLNVGAFKFSFFEEQFWQPASLKGRQIFKPQDRNYSQY